MLSIRLEVIYASAIINAGYSNALNYTLVRMLDLTDLFRVYSKVVGNIRTRGI
jgi:hypothetical protein